MNTIILTRTTSLASLTSHQLCHRIHDTFFEHLTEISEINNTPDSSASSEVQNTFDTQRSSPQEPHDRRILLTNLCGSLPNHTEIDPKVVMKKSKSLSRLRLASNQALPTWLHLSSSSSYYPWIWGYELNLFTFKVDHSYMKWGIWFVQVFVWLARVNVLLYLDDWRSFAVIFKKLKFVQPRFYEHLIRLEASSRVVRNLTLKFSSLNFNLANGHVKS